MVSSSNVCSQLFYFFRFPDQPPSTKEEYMYREMFSHHFPSSSAKKTVPSQGKSIACSTAAAIAWDTVEQTIDFPLDGTVFLAEGEGK